jgi:hypothetical protein
MISEDLGNLITMVSKKSGSTSKSFEIPQIALPNPRYIEDNL